MARPSKVLSPLSEKRINQNSSSSEHSLSDSAVPKDLQHLQYRNPSGVSDVQAKIAQINSLSNGDSPGPSPVSSATALQRAVLGREQSESNVAVLKAQLAEAKHREERMSERLEELLEELHSTRERQANERAIFGREVKKARKEAFGTESSLLQAQEELKGSKLEVRSLNDQVQHEQEEKAGAVQQMSDMADRFRVTEKETEDLKEAILRELEEKNRAIEQSILWQEKFLTLVKDSESLRDKLQSLEAENNSLIPSKQSGPNDHDVSLLENQQPPPRQRHVRASLAKSQGSTMAVAQSSSIKRSSPSLSYFAENASPTASSKRQRMSSGFGAPEEADDSVNLDSPISNVLDLQDELDLERWLREKAEKTIEFMCLECQFKACRCRMAEAQGTEYVYDFDYHDKVKAAAEKEKAEVAETEVREVDDYGRPQLRRRTMAGEELLVTFSPEAGTFQSFPSHSRPADEIAPRAPSAQVDLLTQSPVKVDARRAEPTTVQPSPKKAAEVDLLSLSPMKTQDYVSRQTVRMLEPPPSPAPPSRSEDYIDPETPISREMAREKLRASREQAHGAGRSTSAIEGSVRSGGMGIISVRGAKRIPAVHMHTMKGNPRNGLGERRDLSAPTRTSRWYT